MLPIPRTVRRAGLLLVVFSVLLSCATAPDSRDDAALAGFLAELEGSTAAQAAEMSRLPFAFDAEVLVRDGDLDTLWVALKESDFSLAEVRVDNVVPSYDPSILGEGFLPQAFARRIAEEPVSVVDVESRSGLITLLIEATGYRSFALRGIRRSL